MVMDTKEIRLEDIEPIPLDAYLDDGHLFSDGDNDSGDMDVAEYLGAKEPEDEKVYANPEAVTKKKEPGRPKKKNSALDKSSSDFVLEPFWDVPDSIKSTYIGRLAESISEAYEFPEMSAFMTLLGAASAAVSTNFVTAYPGGKCINVGLYVVVEQPPATGKSRILEVLMTPYSKAMRMHNKRVACKNMELAERTIDLPVMLASFVNTTEPTSAAMDGAMSKMADGRFVVASSEQSALTMLFPQGGSFASTNELLLKGWPGEEAIIMRGSRQSFAGHACGSVVLVAQDGSARTVLSESGGTGLAERFMFVAEPSLLGQRELLGNEPDEELMRGAKHAITECVRLYSDRVFERWNTGVYEKIAPEDLQVVQPGREGFQIISRFKHAIEPRLGRLKESGQLLSCGWLGKADAHVLKVAAVIHVFECMASGSKVPEIIPGRVVQAAEDLVMALFEHFTSMLSSNGDSGASVEEDAVVEVLSHPMPRRSLVLKLKNRSPFRSMGKNAYAKAGARVDAMITAGSLVVNANGKIEVV